jgi:hypothetical protein
MKLLDLTQGLEQFNVKIGEFLPVKQVDTRRDVDVIMRVSDIPYSSNSYLTTTHSYLSKCYDLISI